MNKGPVRRIIITGTSGTGKTTLAHHLGNLGYQTFEEPGRRVLSDNPPFDEPAALVRAMLALSVAQFQEASAADIAFFDRGVPDTLAYAKRFQIDAAEFKTASAQYRYDETVFVTPPWQEIFEPDEYRRGTFEDYTAFHEQLVDAYENQGYTLVEVPRDCIDERVAFILGHVNKQP